MSAPNPQDGREEAPGDEYGWTCALTTTGDLKQTSLNRLALIHDENAVVQSLKVALATPEGFDPLRPNYGLDLFRAFGTTDAEFRLAIEDCIGPNAEGIERVQRIDNIEINRLPGERSGIDVTIAVTLRDSTHVQFRYGLRPRNYRGMFSPGTQR